MTLARNTNLQMDSNLTNLRRPRQEPLHDMLLARQEMWLQETAEVQAAVSARATKRLEEPCLRAQAHRVELNERSNKYFYRCMRAKTPEKCISKLLTANGKPVSTPEAIKERLCEFYTELFAQGETSEATQGTLMVEWPARLNQQQQNSLDVPFTAAKIEEEIDRSPYDKSPGPDGLKFEFYK